MACISVLLLANPGRTGCSKYVTNEGQLSGGVKCHVRYQFPSNLGLAV